MARQAKAFIKMPNAEILRMKDRISVSWRPDEFENVLPDRSGLARGDFYSFVDVVNDAMRCFDPLARQIFDRYRAQKRKLLKRPSCAGVEICLTENPNSSIYEIGKYVFVDYELNPISLLETPPAKTATGPLAVRVFSQSLNRLEAAGVLDASLARECIRDFEDANFQYNWPLKDVKIGRQDFRLRIDIAESSEGIVAALILSSEKHDLKEQIEIYRDEGNHPGNGRDAAAVYMKISLDELRDVKLDSSGIHIARTYEAKLAAQIKQSDVVENENAKLYRIHVGRGDLSSKVCDLLGFDGAP